MRQESHKALDCYFKELGNEPETINHSIKKAALIIATMCGHPGEMTTDDLEVITRPLEYLSDIIDIVDRYETQE